MLSKESIIEELTNRGYDVESHTVVKNGDCVKQAITIRDKTNVAPSIYIDDILNDCTSTEEACEMIVNIYNSRPPFTVDMNDICSATFIKNTVRIGIQKTSDQDGIKKSTCYPQLEQYLFYGNHNSSNEGSWSIRLTDAILKNAGLSDIDELWTLAEQHTFSLTNIKSMAEILSGMIGEDFCESGLFGDGPEFYVISTSDNIKGAAAILDQNFLKNFAEKHNWSKIAILPSSIYECIIVPVDDEFCIEQFDEMVREVNNTQVSPEEQLLNNCLVVDFGGDI